jgi:hypothetical protein
LPNLSLTNQQVYPGRSNEWTDQNESSCRPGRTKPGPKRQQQPQKNRECQAPQPKLAVGLGDPIATDAIPGRPANAQGNGNAKRWQVLYESPVLALQEKYLESDSNRYQADGQQKKHDSNP